MNDKISLEDLETIYTFQRNVTLHKALADAASAELRSAELELRNTILGIYIKYGLSNKDSFNQKTGEIILNSENDKEEK